MKGACEDCERCGFTFVLHMTDEIPGEGDPDEGGCED